MLKVVIDCSCPSQVSASVQQCSTPLTVGTPSSVFTLPTPPTPLQMSTVHGNRWGL
jgi:hypothetical protein